VFFQIDFAEFGNITPHHVPAQKASERRYLADDGTPRWHGFGKGLAH